LTISKNKLNLNNLFLFFCLSLLHPFKFAEYRFEFESDFEIEELAQLNRKIMLDLKERRKIDIFYNYIDVNLKILVHLYFRSLALDCVSSSGNGFSFSFVYYYLSTFKRDYIFKKYTNRFFNK
jgi:hypothetical protein